MRKLYFLERDPFKICCFFMGFKIVVCEPTTISVLYKQKADPAKLMCL